MMKQTPRILCILLLVITLPTITSAQMKPILKHRVGIPPYEVLKKVLQTNLTPETPPQLPQANMANQAPYLTWLADSDARVQSRFLLPASSGLLYSVRNLANQLVLSLGAVDFGVRYLHTPVLLITGNSDSEALALFLTDHQALPTTIQSDLDHLYVPARRIGQEQKKKKLSLAQKVLRLAEHNVDHQVTKAVERYQERIKAGRLVVIGAVLDISNDYGKGQNRLVIININGETDTKALRRMRLTNNLAPELKEFLGRKDIGL